MTNQSHVFNENKKRFEPTDTSCRFCSTGKMISMNHGLFVPLFKENDRTNIIVYRSVKFMKLEVGFARCASCFEKHDSAKTKSIVFSILIGLVIFGVIYVCLDIAIFGAFIGLFAGLVIAFLMPNAIFEWILKNDGLSTHEDVIVKDEVVQDFVISGWSRTAPSA
jgi:hypothetical protein